MSLKIQTEELTQNLKKCRNFARCNQNRCPLDFELHLRTGSESDKCRWMRKASKTKIGSKEFVSGGRVMPDAILIFVPESNLKWLNRVSQRRWIKFKQSKYENNTTIK